MPDENLVKYIKEGLAQGRTEDILRPLLLAAGWTPQAIDEAFASVKGVAMPASTSSPASASAFAPGTMSASAATAASAPSHGRKWAWMAGLAAALVAVIGGGWAAYAYFMNPSPQQVLDAMFQNGFSGMTSADNDTALALNIHFTPASTTASASASASAPAAMPYAAMLLGGNPATLSVQASSSGVFASDAGGNRNTDENIQASVNIGTSGETIAVSGAGEVRVVDGVAYLNLATVPSFGIFNLSALQGKWIALQADSSTESLAQNFIGAPSLAVPSGTLSAADVQSIIASMEQAITITKTLPDETVGGVSDYHYQYVIDPQGAQRAALSAAAIAAHALQGATSTLDASTTAAINEGVTNFLGAFTSMGGDLWIGKHDHDLHQASLSLAFSTTTPAGDIQGTLTVTSTLANINGQQSVSAPEGAESIQAVFQSLVASSPALSATQSAGRDARRISDLHEIQNALELYYNKCGYYPGSAAAFQACPAVHAQITTFASLSAALRGSSSLGITTVPNDPSAGATYYYGTDAAGSRYILAARLEDPNNAVFMQYMPPSFAGIRISGIASCAAPMYCLSL